MQHIVEMDARLRGLQRAASHGDLDAVAAYLSAMARAGNPLDLSVIGSRPERLIAYLWKNKLITLLFNSAYPFGNPGTSDAVLGVRTLASILRTVHGKAVQGVQFTPFYKIVRAWLERNRQTHRFGRTSSDTPLEGFIRHGDADEELSYDVDGEHVMLHNTLWFPTPDQAAGFGFHYGELVAIGDHINGGAIIRVSDWGTRELTLFRTPVERVGAWAQAEEAYQEHEQAVNDEAEVEAINSWAGQFNVDVDVLTQILRDDGISADPPDEWRREDIQRAINDYIDATAKQQAPGQYRDLTRQRVIGSASVSDVENMLGNWMRREELELDPATWRTEVRRLWDTYEQGR